MNNSARDIYVPADSWKTMVDVVAPTPRGMDPAFVKALEPFQRYSSTIKGELGEAIRRCQDHLERFLTAAQEVVEAESGEQPSRLGQLRPFPYGPESLSFQVFEYKGAENVSVREDNLCKYLSQFDLFIETMKFMDKKVAEGNLGVLKNSFTFIHKPLEQAAQQDSAAIEKLPIDRTTVYGERPDPQYVEIAGDEQTGQFEPGTICRILKPGYAFEGREIQEGVVYVASQPA